MADSAAVEVPLTRGPQGSARVESLDMLRGLIMLVMAWDHVKDGLLKAFPTNGFDLWCGPYADFGNDVGVFIARWVSNICAPGFFHTMGIGMILYTASRLKKGQTYSQIARHFLIRGFVLLLVGRWVNVPNMWGKLIQYGRGEVVSLVPIGPPDASLNQIVVAGLIGIFEVMEGLGFTMMFAGMVVVPIASLRPVVGAVVAVVLGVCVFITSNAYIVENQGNPIATTTPWPRCLQPAVTFGEVVVRFLIAPGQLGSVAMTIYPVIPWLGVTLIGFGHGIWFRHDSERAARKSWMLGLITGSLFILLRAVGGFVGNYRGPPRGENIGESINPFISAMNVTKYPPSPTYYLFTITVNYFLLWLLHVLSSACEEWANPPILNSDHQPENSTNTSPTPTSTMLQDKAYVALRRIFAFLLIFGRVPLFFYAMHFWLIGVWDVIVTAAGADGLDYWPLPFFWVLTIGVMVYPCIRYNKFKSKTPATSLWRLF
eukprot:PhF_6_TR40672/c0_g1_i1/m.61098